MPGATSHGLPYPLGTEPVAAGAAAIEDLADTVDSDLWQTYTVTILGAAPTGTTTTFGRYRRMGKDVDFQITILPGSPSMGIPGQHLYFSLPFVESSQIWMFNAGAYDSTPGDVYPLWARSSGTGQAYLYASPDPGGGVGTAGEILRPMTAYVPASWTLGDQIWINGSYTAA